MNKQEKNKLIASILVKTIAVISSIYGLYWSLSTPMILTYFTTLSNIAILLVLLVFIVADVMLLKSDGAHSFKNNSWYILKYVLTISITITFLVFTFILAPTMPGGIFNAFFGYYGFSFCLHFLTPVLAIADFLLFDDGYQAKKIHALYATFPALIYAAAISIAGTAGVRWGNMSAPYNFLNFIAPTGWFGFDLSILGPETLGIGVAYMIAVLFFIFLLLGLFYLKIRVAHR